MGRTFEGLDTVGGEPFLNPGCLINLNNIHRKPVVFRPCVIHKLIVNLAERRLCSSSGMPKPEALHPTNDDDLKVRRG